MSDIVHVKLINGDDLVARLIHINDEVIVLEAPMVVEERENSMTGASVLVLVKYVHSKDNAITVRRDHVITSGDVHPIFEKYYNISKVYYEKFVEENIYSEVEKVTSAMEDALFSPPKAETKSELKSSSNNTIH